MSLESPVRGESFLALEMVTLVRSLSSVLSHVDLYVSVLYGYSGNKVCQYVHSKDCRSKHVITKGGVGCAKNP